MMKAFVCPIYGRSYYYLIVLSHKFDGRKCANAYEMSL